MPKFTLIAEHLDDNDNPTSTVTHEFYEDYLPEVVMMAESFLRGVGFCFNGTLDIIEDEEPISFDFSTMNDQNIPNSFTSDTITITTGSV